MLHFEDPRSQPETDPNQIVVVNHQNNDKIAFSTTVLIAILILTIVGLFIIILWSHGAIMGV